MNNTKPLKVLSLFSGIGAFEKALTKLNIDYELVNFSEIDKFAIKSYCAIHNVSETKNLGDINNIELKDLNKDIDLLTFGSPCQDFSIAGQGKGAKWTCTNCNYSYNPLIINYKKRHNCPNCNSDNIIKTRSSLLVEGLKIINYIRPKYVVYENVKNLVGKKFINTFNLFIKELEDYGYKVKYKVLNSIDFNIPQNRERVFVVAIRNDINKDYEFPQKMKRTVSLVDILEENPKEKYFLKKEKSDSLIKKLLEDFNIEEIPICVASRGRNPNNPNLRQIGLITKQRLEPNKNGITNTLTTVQKDNYLLIGNTFLYKKYKMFYNNNGYLPTYFNPYVCMEIKEVSPTLLTTCGTIGCYSSVLILLANLRIRKFSPKETFRLMGFLDEDFERATAVNSDTQLYKQAGNSIVVNVLENIFKNLLTEYL